MRKVAVVLLNYNSENDLFKCVSDLQAQQNVNLKLIIVDNASRHETVQAVKGWSLVNHPHAISGTTAEILDKNSSFLVSDSDFYIIYNKTNGGYSAGNNIGIKLADRLGCDAVMISNPDMRFEDPLYVKTLDDTLFSKEKAYISASKIVGLDGKEQSPLREATFWEEFTWPRFLLKRFFKSSAYLLPYQDNVVSEVPKVMGCCLMLKMDFLKTIGFLDETTFLYAEEPILSAQVKQHNGCMLFNPMVEALHAHKASAKGNSSKRMLQFIKSRRYYLHRYSGYSTMQLALLEGSYALLYALHWMKVKITQ